MKMKMTLNKISQSLVESPSAELFTGGGGSNWPRYSRQVLRFRHRSCTNPKKGELDGYLNYYEQVACWDPRLREGDRRNERKPCSPGGWTPDG